MEPKFLSFAEIDLLHEKSIQTFGGTRGIRDLGLIESAIASAQNDYFYGQGDLYSVAAAYAYHLAQAQAFFWMETNELEWVRLCFF